MRNEPVTERTMSDETKTETNDGAEAGGGDANDPRKRMGDGIRQGLGVLTAFKDALEETIQEARDRGDLSADRAKEVMKETLEKAQTAAEDAKGRLDFATQADIDAAVDSIRERVSALEEKVFGAAKSDEPATKDETSEDAS